jgi:hypothetical protein
MKNVQVKKIISTAKYVCMVILANCIYLYTWAQIEPMQPKQNKNIPATVKLRPKVSLEQKQADLQVTNMEFVSIENARTTDGDVYLLKMRITITNSGDSIARYSERGAYNFALKGFIAKTVNFTGDYLPLTGTINHRTAPTTPWTYCYGDINIREPIPANESITEEYVFSVTKGYGFAGNKFYFTLCADFYNLIREKAEGNNFSAVELIYPPEE